jgi:hypothetical protein
MRRLRANLNYSNVVATAALVVAVAGAADLAGFRVVTRSASTGILTAPCEKNERLISGGANQQGDPQSRFFASYPDGNGWTAITLANSIPSAQLTVYAICLKAKPGN